MRLLDWLHAIGYFGLMYWLSWLFFEKPSDDKVVLMAVLSIIFAMSDRLKKLDRGQ